MATFEVFHVRVKRKFSKSPISHNGKVLETTSWPFKVIWGQQLWCQTKAHIQVPICPPFGLTHNYYSFWVISVLKCWSDPPDIRPGCDISINDVMRKILYMVGNGIERCTFRRWFEINRIKFEEIITKTRFSVFGWPWPWPLTFDLENRTLDYKSLCATFVKIWWR